MKSKTVTEMLSDLHVTKPHSRPTLEYQPVFPERFDSLEHAREFCVEFFRWYNHDHRPTGVGQHSPASVHCGPHS